jgi:glycosyltransferase involved in cell wall biosynthesis
MSVLPQVEPCEDIEVLVIDNASPDNTKNIVEELAGKYPFLRYVRNPENLGYAGNQAKCIELPKGHYAAILCDDDVYRHDAIATMHPILSQREYAFMAINYFGFNDDPHRPTLQEITKQEDKFSENAYSIFELPGVGHYSGFILNVSLARKALNLLLEGRTISDFEKQRGILHDIVIISTKSSDMPGYFIGKTIMGAGMPPTIDYDSLRHICMDTYKGYLRHYQNGYITRDEFDFRKKRVIRWLPKALLRNGGSLSAQELISIPEQLQSWFGDDSEFQRTCSLILYAIRFSCIRRMLRMGVRGFLFVKRLRGAK